MNIGKITPISLMECVPGDSFNIKTTNLMRFAPLIAPVMHQSSVYCHFFFIPNRILWANWEEFITGGEVAASDPTPQGNMAGHGVSVGSSNYVSYKCEEHGYILGLMTVMPKSAYQDGLPKHFSKFDKFDYFWPSFANIGEQPILNKELYLDASDGQDDNVFGYTPRYAEYKYLPSTVHGEFRSSLDFWHMGRIFTSRPNLNATFVECNESEVDRVFAVPA
jgi:hypothetical protein